MKDKKKGLIVDLSEVRYLLKDYVHSEEWENERGILDDARLLNKAMRRSIEMLDEIIDKI